MKSLRTAPLLLAVVATGVLSAETAAQSVWTPMDRKVEIRVAAWAPEIG